jgi:ParB/RepB/Spo0J family partition protein
MKTITPNGAQLLVAPEALHEAPWNPRHERNQAALDALTASVRDVGILQPLVVRQDDDGSYQVVCGHRRLAAARAAGLEAVPVNVVQTDVDAAYAMAVAENLQREDLTPIDEAEAYAEMVKAGHTIEGVAAHVGKSKTHVSMRMQLTSLPQIAQEALRAGAITVAIAELIGRVPGEAQRVEATEKLLTMRRVSEWRPDEQGGAIFEPVSLAAARRHLTETYMLALASAPFDVNDAQLVPAAGSCAACPHRTGNQVNLFGDVLAEDGADVCTYPTCYAMKRAAHVEVLCAQVDLPRLSLEETDKVFPPGGTGRVSYNAKWVDADQPDASNRTGKKTLRKALGDEAPAEHVAVDTNGKLRGLYKKKAVETALRAKAADDNTPAKTPSNQPGSNPQVELILDEAVSAIHRVITARGSTPETLDTERLLKAVAAQLLVNGSLRPAGHHATVLEAGSTNEVLKELKKHGLETVIVMMAEALFMPLTNGMVRWDGDGDDHMILAEIEKIYGFKLEKAVKDAEAQVDAKAVGVAQPDAAHEPAPQAQAKKTTPKRAAKKPTKKATKKAAKKPAKKARTKK